MGPVTLGVALKEGETPSRKEKLLGGGCIHVTKEFLGDLELLGHQAFWNVTKCFTLLLTLISQEAQPIAQAVQVGFFLHWRITLPHYHFPANIFGFADNVLFFL